MSHTCPELGIFIKTSSPIRVFWGSAKRLLMSPPSTSMSRNLERPWGPPLNSSRPLTGPWESSKVTQTTSQPIGYSLQQVAKLGCWGFSLYQPTWLGCPFWPTVPTNTFLQSEVFCRTATYSVYAYLRLDTKRLWNMLLLCIDFE